MLVGIPKHITLEPPDHIVDVLALSLTTSFAGNEAGHECDIAMEALAWMGQPTPPVQILLTGHGGNSKSARTTLRGNVFGGPHTCMGAGVFQELNEFRIQGCHFAFYKCITVQECEAGRPLCEYAWKRLCRASSLRADHWLAKQRDCVDGYGVGKSERHTGSFPA